MDDKEPRSKPVHLILNNLHIVNQLSENDFHGAEPFRAL